jgi:alkylhydroperoxidase family enzyme
LITGSKYEWAQHYPIAKEMGLTEEQIKAVADWKGSKAFNKEEQAVLQYTDEVDRHTSVKDGTFEALRAFLSERSIVELTLSIGYWGMVARLLVPLQLEIDVSTVGSAQELIGRKK